MEHLDDIALNDFNYSSLDQDISIFLQNKAFNINRITSKSAYEIGKELKEAQDKLAKDGYGFFGEWYSSLGFKKTKAYQYINHYNFVRSESEQSKIEMFESAPKSIQTEISKPSAKKEVNDAYFDGDITTRKEYKDMEKKIEEKDRQIERLKRSEQIAIDKLEQKQNEEPKEVFPRDYEEAKAREQQLSSALKKAQTEADEYKKSYEYEKEQYKKLIEKRANVNEKSEKYDQLTEAIDNAEGRLSNSQKLISDYKDILKIIRGGNEAILKIGGLAFMDISKTVNSSTVVSSEFDSLINSLERLIRDLREVRNQNIIEGDFTNGE